MKWVIRYNPLWKTYQCSFDGVLYEEFKTMPEAVEYCKRGSLSSKPKIDVFKEVLNSFGGK